MPDLEQQRIAGVPLLPAVLVLGAAGLVGWWIFFKNSTKDPNSSATGYSSQGLAVMQNPDESATMALQNQELSILAQDIGGIGDLINNVQASVNDTRNAVGSVGTMVTGVQASVNDTRNAVGSVGTMVGGLGGQLGSMQDSINGQNAAAAAYSSSLATSLSNFSNANTAQFANQ